MNNAYPYTIDIGNGESITYTTPRVENRSSVLGIGFRVYSPHTWTDGTETEHRESVVEFPFIGNAPFMSIRLEDGTWSQMTRVINPDRFGPLPTSSASTPTKADVKIARAWVETFTRGVEVDR